MFDFVISLVILAAVALAAGAVFLFRRGDRRRAVLMAVLSMVMIANAVIWLAPMEGGGSMAERAAAAGQ
ncbi:hypothetical protein [Aurantiacibacter spongiae]|uniref:Uncharacterized protein n=1 Tax=Aurantiacibacter spongiae TaxID=2488860 RepID=A0A3N5CVH0_9SPHN|nr:hypothetical protein [Aurantiacibacter spongiae]RPF72346.1 hypothetical protein EG799_12460 [Aurantiacibacter spongiae]